MPSSDKDRSYYSVNFMDKRRNICSPATIQLELIQANHPDLWTLQRRWIGYRDIRAGESKQWLVCSTAAFVGAQAQNALRCRTLFQEQAVCDSHEKGCGPSYLIHLIRYSGVHNRKNFHKHLLRS